MLKPGMLRWAVFYSTALQCSMLKPGMLRWAVFYSTALQCSMLKPGMLRWAVFYSTALQCSMLKPGMLRVGCILLHCPPVHTSAHLFLSVSAAYGMTTTYER
ncbi:hypothetical protein BaRGS_00020868 [Batillaria attramentaria]|uniref:Secreted protein n=1 Tax=Batillaria attramentaria TaxID=370345 RepID=A0ABD0KLH4_9CAEN